MMRSPARGAASLWRCCVVAAVLAAAWASPRTLLRAGEKAGPAIPKADGPFGGPSVRVEGDLAAAARVSAPLCVEIALPADYRKAAQEGRLVLAEAGAGEGAAVPAQYEAGAAGGAGKLWWLARPSKAPKPTYRLVIAAGGAPADGPTSVTARYDPDRKCVDVAEGKLPVLRYNHGQTAVPKGLAAKYARGDYIHPLYGPDAQPVTDDFPRDHPHHRAINWSWATVRWRGQERDMFGVGVQAKGAWARPEGTPAVSGGFQRVAAFIHATCLWKWDDTDPIVREDVTIRAFRQVGRCRFVDVDVRLTPLVDGLEFCGRLGAGYSGFNIRMAPGKAQKIAFHTDEPESQPRRCWGDYSAQIPPGKGRVGLTILQHVANPMYPNAWREYPQLNFYQPIYPGPKLIPMPKGKTIVLRHRLWVHPGEPQEATFQDVWSAYNQPPTEGPVGRVTVVEP